VSVTRGDARRAVCVKQVTWSSKNATKVVTPSVLRTPRPATSSVCNVPRVTTTPVATQHAERLGGVSCAPYKTRRSVRRVSSSTSSVNMVLILPPCPLARHGHCRVCQTNVFRATASGVPRLASTTPQFSTVPTQQKASNTLSSQIQ
jgi:hypothetical protein